jgi:hypothetical protein
LKNQSYEEDEDVLNNQPSEGKKRNLPSWLVKKGKF